MGSPLGPVLANIFMCAFEEKWFMNAKISPSFWNQHADDTFTMFHLSLLRRGSLSVGNFLILLGLGRRAGNDGKP